MDYRPVLLIMTVIMSIGIYLVIINDVVDVTTNMHGSEVQADINTRMATKRYKLILLWNKLYKDPSFRLGNLSLGSCPCVVTIDKAVTPVADAIVFHMTGQKSNTILPPKRYISQLYVNFITESPASRLLAYANDAINVTVTYRRDSDIFWPYWRIQQLESQQNGWYHVDVPLRKREKNVVWLVSHCETVGQREDYVLELKKYIDVEIWGKCGNVSCPKETMVKCMSVIKSKYKFYLSFENSYCEDYVTEKFTRAVNYELLPIVYGGTDYLRDAPPNSYINIEDFQSPRHLAQYLHQLGSDSRAYEEYFQWKLTHSINRETTKDIFCKLCHILHDTKYSKRYRNFTKWWHDGRCDNEVITRSKIHW